MSILQSQLNNNSNVAIDLTSNKIVYKFKIKETLLLLYKDYSIIDVFKKRLEFHAKTINVIVFAKIKAKIYYNARHQLLLFNFEDKIYLRLNHNYYLLEKLSKKILSQQCDSFFLIKKRIDRLVYFLKLSSM